jgi:hypothetical protein
MIKLSVIGTKRFRLIDSTFYRAYPSESDFDETTFQYHWYEREKMNHRISIVSRRGYRVYTFVPPGTHYG